MSDQFFYMDESTRMPDRQEYSAIVERLKRDVFLNDRLVTEGTLFTVVPPEMSSEV